MPNRIDINNADQEDLEAVAGITAVEAALVVEFRQAIGFFSTLDDLVKIPGLTPAALRKIKAHVKIG